MSRVSPSSPPREHEAVYLPHLRAWRLARYFSRSSIAYRTGVTAAWVYELERGNGRASWYTVRRIARALGISPQTLIERAPTAQQDMTAGTTRMETPAVAATAR